MTEQWGTRANLAQDSLDTRFWNETIRMYNIEAPCPDGTCNTIFHYWWMAHAVDNLVDAYVRTDSALYEERLAQLYDGLLERNGGQWPNPLYDDMEWMALAWLRAYQATGIERYREAVDTLWADIRTGWNEHCGGGIAWQKTQLDYKNTPANAPAAILAARLYQAFGREEDRAWAERIYAWLKTNLVDPVSGFVWDGMNREGDGKIDKDWKFTYCQGVYIGAGVELYRVTGDEAYLEDANRTADAAKAELAHPETGLLPLEGTGDGGLFKGILVRYLAELVRERPSSSAVASWLNANAELLWGRGRGDELLFSGLWNQPARETVELSTQLSGVMLLEAAARLESLPR